jgi:hypothetical protein
MTPRGKKCLPESLGIYFLLNKNKKLKVWEGTDTAGMFPANLVFIRKLALSFFNIQTSWMPALHHTRYRARFRGHDELRDSLSGGRRKNPLDQEKSYGQTNNPGWIVLGHYHFLQFYSRG